MDLTAGDLKKVIGIRILNERPLSQKFTSVTIDSRRYNKGSVFFAVKGERFDGHDFLKQAFKNGAACAIVNKVWYNRLSENKKRSFSKHTLALVNDTLKALGLLANIYRKKFILPVIAISGSNGKTSVKDHMAHVLSKKYNVLKTEGNLNNQYGVPLTLFRLRQEHEIAVVELGTNHFGEVKYLAEIAAPQFGMITNIGKEHLEFLHNIEGVTKAECELLDYLDRNSGMFFLNADDRILVKENRKRRVSTFSFGFGGRVDVKGKLLGFSGLAPEIEIGYEKKKFMARLKGIGKQSSNAALAASAAGFYFEVPRAKIKQAISEYDIESGKRNQLKKANGVLIIDDSYNSNPDSVKAALENMKAYRIKGRKHLVLADMLELGKAGKREHFETGRLVKKMGFENLYTYGSHSLEIFRGAQGIKRNFHFDDKHVLAEFLKINLNKGDLILVKGSRSMKMEDVVESISS